LASEPALAAALARLGRNHPRAIDLSLGRIQARLAALGHPERKLPPVFHVAGTNGKGSTVAFLRAFLEAAGYRCHVYTSPHLVRFNERIRLAGRLIEDDALVALIDEVERVAPDAPITEFEFVTTVAFLAFSRTPAEAALVEVGLGGRHDATNLFSRPAATAVTRVSYDHRQFLGDDLAGIAREKAGIFKPGAPAIVAAQPAPEAWAALTGVAEDVGAQPFLYGSDWQVSEAIGGFRYEGPARALDLPHPALVGRHQWMNAGTALTMIDAAAGFTVDDAAVRRGLAEVAWPGRLQQLRRGTLAALAPPPSELWLDGAHNDSGGESLAVQAALWNDLPLDLIFGVRADKKPTEILGPLAPLVARLRAVPIPGDAASLSPRDAASAARAAGFTDVAPAGSVREALTDLTALPGPRRILVCGSLYLAGAVLEENGTPPE
jgi:dihydrofolate synthase/folylpolyglutamate synthase